MKHVVLLKSRSNNHGGLEKYASRIAKAFIERGSRVTILTTGKALRHSEIPVVATKTIPWPAFARMEQFDWFVRKWLKKNGADLVFGMDRNRYQTHIRAGNGVHAAYLKSRILTEGKMKALFCELNPLHRKILELEKAAFENPALQKLFTNSHMVRNQVLEHYAVEPDKVQVIHNGVEWKEMETDFSSWESRKAEGLKKFFLDPNQFHFLFIGNGYLRKGLDRLLLALSQLKNESFHLSVIGKDNQMDLFRAKAIQLGLKDQVHFFGPSQEIRLFYQLADCLVIPSFYDPFANVTVEALAMGLFVLSSKLNGGHEILTPAINQGGKQVTISASEAKQNRFSQCRTVLRTACIEESDLAKPQQADCHLSTPLVNNGAVIEDLLDPDAMVDALRIAIKNKKTARSAEQIRNSVKHLDFSNQLRILMESCHG